MTAIKSRSLRYLFHAPAYLYRWHLGRVLGHRFLLLTHIGRRTGLRHQTVLEVMDYHQEIPEAVVMSGFGPNSDWLRNIQANSEEDIVLGDRSFAAVHRFLGEHEAAAVLQKYERQNRFLAPIVRSVLSALLGWKYRGSESDRLRLVRQLPLVAFRPR
ncbi:MAG: nitroreductase family deazaflavin-dependent oxidoreductase [Terriglobales bacterium]